MNAPASIDLLQKYPTHLSAGDTDGEKARPWEFSSADIYRISKFKLQIAEELKVEVGAADLAIGHCIDGAVWAVVMPRESGTLTAKALKSSESIGHVWLRFHPAEIARIFPPDTVFADGRTNLLSQMSRIANLKFSSSWHAGPNAMIPEPKDMTVDADIKGGPRRFFAVDTDAKTAQYWPVFEKRAVKPPKAIATGEAESGFDQLWQAFDEKYAMFVLRPEVDWTKLRDEYRPKAIASKDTMEFAGVCAEMLKPLRDLHVWFEVAGEYVPVFNRPRKANSNPDAHSSFFSLHEERHGVQWGVTENKIGFIGIYGWNDPAVPVECQTALENMRDTRGLIVDVRLNGGGSEDQAMEFAGRFLKEEFVYGYSQYRNGPAHSNLTEKWPRKIEPRGPWRYDRPVVVLIGQKCMSSCESFVGMMTGDPNVTTMGDHTCGSSGNPALINLPLQMNVSVPQWIDYRPDGKPLDERGFEPQVRFDPDPSAFSGQKDALLAEALNRLRQAPLPDKPITGPIFLPPEEAEGQDESRPKVVSVFPENGAQSVEAVTKLRVRFDRPMDPLAVKLDWKSAGFLDSEFPQYDPEKYEFTIPVRLPPGTSHRVVINEPMGGDNLSEARANYPRDGFMSSDHRLARIFAWTFGTAPPAVPIVPPPKVLKITPPPGSRVPYRTFMEIQFDQTMKSRPEALPYLDQPVRAKQARMICDVAYDDATHTFRIPLLLPPKEEIAFAVAGFFGASWQAAEPIKLEYQVSDEELSVAERAKFDESAKNPTLLKALDSIKQSRNGLTSVAERIQTLSLRRDKSLFTGLQAQSASFKWQQPNLYYADVSDIMMMCAAFKIGCDGKNWWHHLESGDATNFVVCAVSEMQKLNISICDPFNLTEQTPQEAAAGMNLSYLGVTTFAGCKCRALEGWNIERVPEIGTFGSLIRWQVDEQSGRPLEITQYTDYFLRRSRFIYDAVNQPLAADAFAVPKIAGQSPAPPDALDKDYTNRFVTLRDGCDGSMSLRWGKEGPKGRSSDGLN